MHNWRYSLPKSVLRHLSEEESVQWMLWEGSFEDQETILRGDAQLLELENFVRRVHPYSRALWLYADASLSRTAGLAAEVINKSRKIFRVA